MAIWKFKSCAKCHGDVFIEKDEEGWCARCLQCGRRFYPKPVKKVASSRRTERTVETAVTS